jgi:hypothetical protein
MHALSVVWTRHLATSARHAGRLVDAFIIYLFIFDPRARRRPRNRASRAPHFEEVGQGLEHIEQRARYPLRHERPSPRDDAPHVDVHVRRGGRREGASCRRRGVSVLRLLASTLWLLEQRVELDAPSSGAGFSAVRILVRQASSPPRSMTRNRRRNRRRALVSVVAGWRWKLGAAARSCGVRGGRALIWESARGERGGIHSHTLAAITCSLRDKYATWRVVGPEFHGLLLARLREDERPVYPWQNVYRQLRIFRGFSEQKNEERQSLGRGEIV